MNFFINCLKPPGMTSHDVVAFTRRILKTKKVGHTGTLDPSVAGVLPIAVGKATKAIEYLADDKRYRCEALLGMVTDTQDLDGRIIENAKCLGIRPEAITANLKSFVGTIQQVPPMYSAVKIKGQKLYQLARSGNHIDVPARTAIVKKIDVLEIKKNGSYYTILFDIICSKGTYIRTICHDLGQSLGCGGVMSFLVRTAAGPFQIIDSITIEEMEELGPELIGVGISISDSLQGITRIALDEIKVKKLLHGQTISLSGSGLTKVFDTRDTLIGIGEFNVNQDGICLLKLKKTLL